jgi:hypothetical protein
MNIAFFVDHFFERGTEVAIYDYAKYNEELLHNKSYIICFTKNKRKELGYPILDHSYDKFKLRFTIIEIHNIYEITNIIQIYNLSCFYRLSHGGNCDNIFEYNNYNIWKNCKTIKHCVFDTTYPECDFYISISNYLNEKYNTNIPVIPHIVYLPDNNEDLKMELNIPYNSIVFGRYGGKTEFNIEFVQESIIEFINENENIYFLFMNTDIFYEHPRIIYIDCNIELTYKVKFINTCDFMIHARSGGETFGLSIAEFSIKNKPIITCPCGDLEHIQILGDKALLYNTKKELLNIFRNAQKNKKDWISYKLYSPEHVMSLFNSLFQQIKNDLQHKK